MKDFLLSYLEQEKGLSFEDILLHVIVAALIGLMIYLSYWISHTGSVYSKKFNVSLIMLTVLTATVMSVIANNVALSLGMVGALSIVRFRTAIKDSRDTAYIFWTIIVGICCGAGDYLIACVGSSVVFAILLLLGRVRNDHRILLIIKAPRSLETEIEGVIFTQFQRRAQLKVKNTNIDSCEYIYELSRKIYETTLKEGKSITNLLYDKGNIEYVNIVCQSDDIN